MNVEWTWVVATICIPVVAGGFWLLWTRTEAVRRDVGEDRQVVEKTMFKRLDERAADDQQQWTAITALQAKQAADALDAERRFAKSTDIDNLRREITAQFGKVDSQFDKVESRLDVLLERVPPRHGAG
jgi:hypothetical protein